MNTFDVSRMLWDYYLWATVLLTTALLTFLLIRQPARRMALAWAAAVGLLVLLVLTALPNWSRWSLASPAPPPVVPVVERSEPLLIPAPRTEVLAPRETQPQSLVEPAPVQAGAPFDWQAFVLPLLAAGSLTMIGWLALGSWQARRLCKQSLAVPSSVAELFAQLVRDRRQQIELGVHRELPVAVALGLRRPCILLPQTLVDQASAGQLRSVLAHELAHVEHRDLWLLALLRALMVVLWPHPLFWLLRRQVRHDQEVLADMAAAELTSRTDYAEQLVALARSAVEVRVPRLASSVGLWEKRTQLAERIKLLLDEKLTILRNCSRGWRLGSLVALGGLSIALSLVTLSPAEQNDAVEKTETAVSEESTPEQTDVQDAEAIKAPAKSETQDPNKLDLRESLDSLNAKLQPNTVSGICLDENNKPLSGVDVNIYQAKEGAPHEPITIASAKSDADGTFHFENVVDVKREFPDGLPDENFIPRGSPVYNIVARAPGRVPGIGNELAFQIARRGTMKPFSMLVAQSLEGRIVDQDNRPVAGARVSTGSWGEVVGIPENINSAKTDAEGRFEIADLEAYNAEQARKEFEARQQDYLSIVTFTGTGQPWERFVTVEHPEFARKRKKFASIPGSVDVTLAPGAVLTGQIVTQEVGDEPKPAANAEVMAMLLPSAGSPDPLTHFGLGAKADETGNYRFESLPQGVYAVHANLPDWVTNGIGDVNVVVGETVAVPDLVMTRGTRVKIQLVDDATGKPLEFDKPTKAYVNPVHRPSKNNAFAMRPNIVEFSRKGAGETHVPAGNYLFNVVIPSTESAAGWVRADFNSNKSTEEIESVPGQKINEGEVVDIEVRMVREGGPAKSNVVPTAEPAEEKPTGTLIPAMVPAEVETGENLDKQSSIPPKLLYLAWQEESSQPGWGKMVLWNTAGKTLGAAEAQEFLARAGNNVIANGDDSLTPLVLFFEVDKSINAPVMPTLITKEGARISSGSARTQQVDGVNVAVIVASRTSLAAWPDSASLELNYATEDWQVIKTVSKVGDQPIEIADGVRWYLDQERAREFDPETGRLRWAEGKTAGVLELRAASQTPPLAPPRSTRKGDFGEAAQKGLMDYAVRVFLKGQTVPVREVSATAVARDDGNYTIRVSDAFSSADQVERVEFIRQQRAIETVDNVPLRLDLLPVENKRLPNKKSEAYENGVLGNSEVYR